MNSIVAKLGKMRKAVRWTVYKVQEDGTVVIQSSNYIAAFNRNGEGVLSARQPGGAYFVHLNKVLGAKPVKVDTTLVEAVFAVAPKPGDVVANGMLRIV